MILTGQQIRSLAIITPFTINSMQPAGYDAHLSGRFHSDGIIHLTQFSLKSGAHVLSSTMEWFRIPNNIMGIILGKSSLARKGLIVNTTPLEPGWEGNITLSIINMGPTLILKKNDSICQVIFLKLTEPAIPYHGKYQYSKGIRT